MNQEEFRVMVIVPRNRNFAGQLAIEKNGRPLKTIPVLARGSKGPGNTVFQENGNTPTGKYDGSTFQQPLPWREHAYGKYGEIRIKPVSGDALIAEEKHGRRGLLIHAGALGGRAYWRGEGTLRATNGCLRVSDSDMAWLRRHLFAGAPFNTCAQPPKVTITVLEQAR